MVGRRGISIKISFLKIIKPDAESILYLHPAYLCIPLSAWLMLRKWHRVGVKRVSVYVIRFILASFHGILPMHSILSMLLASWFARWLGPLPFLVYAFPHRERDL